jgi:dUTP pyrophosphatase
MEGEKRPIVKIKYCDGVDGVAELKAIKQGDLIDLEVAEDVTMKKGEYKLLSLGVAMALPEGTMAMIFSRSSTPGKHGVMIANSVGIIDESYSGDDDIWRFPAIAFRDTKISKGTRIAQFMVVEKPKKPIFETVAALGNKNRGGFGSTGD